MLDFQSFITLNLSSTCYISFLHSFKDFFSSIIQFSLAVSFFFFFFFCFLGLYPWHMEVPRLGVKSELQLQAYSTATATWDPSTICDLHQSLCQRQILNPLSEARDQTCILMNTSPKAINPLSHNRNSQNLSHFEQQNN